MSFKNLSHYSLCFALSPVFYDYSEELYFYPCGYFYAHNYINMVALINSVMIAKINENSLFLLYHPPAHTFN